MRFDVKLKCLKKAKFLYFGKKKHTKHDFAPSPPPHTHKKKIKCSFLKFLTLKVSGSSIKFHCQTFVFFQDAISALVTMEVKQLHGLSSEDRQLAKRRLLLRWHPDKNAGNGAGNDLAKKVMQGLQVHPEWNHGNQGSVLP